MDECEIRKSFLKGVKTLLKDENFFKSLEGKLPKKEGFFRYVPLCKLYKRDFFEKRFLKKSFLKKEDIEKFVLSDNYIVFVDGVFKKSFSRISKGISIKGFKGDFLEEGFFRSLNSSLSKKFVLEVEENFLIKKPLQILQVITKPSIICPRIEIFLNKNSFLNVFFNAVSLLKEGNVFLNQVIDVCLEEKAYLEATSSFLDENLFCKNLFLFHLFKISSKENSIANLKSILLGKLIEYHDYDISLFEGAMCFLNGLNLLKGRKEGHINVNVNHKGKKSLSKILVKTILKDRAKASFQGVVRMERGAKKSKSSQLNRNLLLSNEVESFARPFLDVFEEDVKATHGATFSKFEEEELFYLQTRGISKKEAGLLLINGFCQEIVDLVKVKELKKILKKILKVFLE
jgi:Fe-S cluster assembly protein SufD